MKNYIYLFLFTLISLKIDAIPCPLYENEVSRTTSGESTESTISTTFYDPSPIRNQETSPPTPTRETSPRNSSENPYSFPLQSIDDNQRVYEMIREARRDAIRRGRSQSFTERNPSPPVTRNNRQTDPALEQERATEASNVPRSSEQNARRNALMTDLNIVTRARALVIRRIRQQQPSILPSIKNRPCR